MWWFCGFWCFFPGSDGPRIGSCVHFLNCLMLGIRWVFVCWKSFWFELFDIMEIVYVSYCLLRNLMVIKIKLDFNSNMKLVWSIKMFLMHKILKYAYLRFVNENSNFWLFQIHINTPKNLFILFKKKSQLYIFFFTLTLYKKICIVMPQWYDLNRPVYNYTITVIKLINQCLLWFLRRNFSTAHFS